MRTHALAALGGLLLLGPAGAETRDWTLEGTVGTTEATLWTPGDVPVLRAVLVTRGLGDGAGAAWHTACRAWQAAHLRLADVPALDGPSLAEALVAALSRFAGEIGRPELPHLPWALVDPETGGNWAAQLAGAATDRTAAFVTSAEALSPEAAVSETAAAVPRLILADGTGAPTEELAYVARLDAQWSWVRLAPEGADRPTRAADVVLPYLQAVMPLRLPTDPDPRSSPVGLRSMATRDGWLGEPPDAGAGDAYPTIAPWTEYEGDKARAVWLPNRALAYVWRSLASQAPPVRLALRTAGGGLLQPMAEGRTLVVPRGQTLTLSAIVDPSVTVAKAHLYDADRQLGSLGEPPWELAWRAGPPGPRSLYVLWETPDARKGVSTPVLVVVRP